MLKRQAKANSPIAPYHIPPRHISFFFLLCLVSLITILLTVWVVLPETAYTSPSTTTFTITWSEGCESPPSEAVTALENAADLWETWIASDVPIEVAVCWTPNLSGGDALGTGAPRTYVRNFAKAPLVDTFYPIALANALSGSDLNPTLDDITLQFKSDAAWSFNGDFTTIALHELAHGLGFIGNMYQDYNIGFCGDGPYGYLYPCPTPYDSHVVDSAGVPLLDYQTPNPRELGILLKSDANFGGPNTSAANGGIPAKLYTPNYWQFGSSLSHLDQVTFQSTPNHLMTPTYSGNTSHPGSVTLGIFQDMGWLRVDGVPNVTTDGPLIVGVGQQATISGTLVWSGYTGQAITYTWEAANHDPVTHPALGQSDSITLTWDTVGQKRLTLTATDGSSAASATRAILVYDLTVSGLSQGDTNHDYTFDANVISSGSFPITYTWEASEQTTVIHSNQNATDSVTFNWSAPGVKIVTVTAVIAESSLQTTHEIEVQGIVLDNFIFLPLVKQ